VISRRLSTMGRARHVSSYHLRTTLHERWSRHLSLVLLVGLVGGIGLGGDRWCASYAVRLPGYLAATDASDLWVQTYDITCLDGLGNGLLDRVQAGSHPTRPKHERPRHRGSPP
jgi:hypothetical protein